LAQKLQEATRAIELGVDELDFVINYTAFKKGNIVLVREEVFFSALHCACNIVKWLNLL
jgi:deoxyribose-phosphate aldolase